MGMLNNGIKAKKFATDSLSQFKTTSDDAYLSWSCFFFQQSIELMLKGILQYYGVKDIPYGHQLANVTDACRELSVRVKKIHLLDETLDAIDSRAETFSSWETKGRYSSKIGVNEKNVNIAVEVCDNILSFIENNKIVDQ